MPTEDRALSQFPTAAAILAATLVMVSTPAPDAPSGYDTNKALAADLGRAILGDFAYTQELQTDIKTIFGAINSLRVLSGTTTPTAQEGANGQLYFKYTVDSQTQEEEITNLYWKRNGTWLEVQLGGGGGGTDYIECTKAQYDAWEQAGTLEEDVLYFITDAQSGGGVVIDDTTTAQDKVWSSSKTNTEIQAVASDLSGKQNKNVLNIRKIYPANTSIANVILDCISTYGKVSMMIGAVITGYGFIHINCIFSDDGQGGGTIVANNKAQNNTQAALWAFQYTNGTITLSYVYN